MNLTQDQVAAAEAAGCQFVPAPDHALHRYTMQRKVFRVSGRNVLATRGGGLFETAATLERLIAEGRALLATRHPPEPEAAEAEIASPPAPRSPRLRRTRPLPPAEPSLQAAPAPAPPPDPAPQEPQPSEAPPTRRARPPQPRWVTAGAERRGRAGVHWSTRLR